MGSAQKRNNGSAHLSERKLSLALALMPDISLLPHMLLVTFKLLLWCWSLEGVSLSKSMCGFFKRNCWGLQKFLLQTESPLVFVARSYGDLFFWHWNPGLAVLICGWDSSLPRYTSQIFIHHTSVWNQPIPCLCVSAPPTNLDGYGFFNSVVVELTIQVNFWWFWVMVVYSLAVSFDVFYWL